VDESLRTRDELAGILGSMNAAQGWTLIGVVFAMLLGLCTMVVYLVRVEFASLRTDLTTRLDVIDRDVQRLYERLFDRS
jgi:hypothetical protein